MRIRVGYEFIYGFPQPTPMILMVSTHYSRASDVVVPDHLTTDPSMPITAYRDGFGNWCTRIVAPAGRIRIAGNGVVRDTGIPDAVVPYAQQYAVQDLPEETLVFLLGSRYCETDLLSETAWQLFGGTRSADGRACRRSAITSITTSPSITRTRAPPAPRAEAYQRADRRLPRLRASRHRLLPLHEYSGAILHRLPGRHRERRRLTPSGDFAAWFEAWIGGGWHIFDPRNNVPRMGRVLMARGRDACRCRDRHHVRTQHAGEFQGLDR